MNSLVRLILYFTIIGTILDKSVKILFIGLTTISCLYFYSINYGKKKVRENFHSMNCQKLEPKTLPTVSNPLMNVLPTDYIDNPDRASAANSSNPAIQHEIEETSYNKNLFSDLSGHGNFDTSMRQFYTNPSTSIPNKQKEFAQYCYGEITSNKLYGENRNYNIRENIFSNCLSHKNLAQ